MNDDIQAGDEVRIKYAGSIFDGSRGKVSHIAGTDIGDLYHVRLRDGTKVPVRRENLELSISKN